jgi:hypothetical protein
MSERTRQIGFSQRVRLEWLEATAQLVLAGNDRATVTAALDELLKDVLSVGGHAEWSNRAKATLILQRVWQNAPPELDALRRDGLGLLGCRPITDHIAVHWGMVMAVYPFWGSVATQVGRLLSLQGSAGAAQVQRRVREQYGERETVSRAAQRVLRCYNDWGVLIELTGKGVYGAAPSRAVEDPELVAWLVEASLRGRPDATAALGDLFVSPSLFPFHLKQISARTLLSARPRLDLLRHGLDDELVMLRERSA